ncbi:MFS transporter [Streptomyces polyrhachis]|uniref:MFS transporter n=1 Tax=Streptomyces polyrhachis TaxID=1282885 RepID=A0ABW2GEY9_9ACTN
MPSAPPDTSPDSAPPPAPTAPPAPSTPIPGGEPPVLRGWWPLDPVLRQLALNTLLTRFGGGLLTAVNVLYFSQVMGLGVTAVGYGLTLNGVGSILSGIPAGRLCDKYGARRVYSAAYFVTGLGILSYLLVDSLAGFLLATTVVGIGWGVVHTANSTWMAVIIPAYARTESRAYLRMLTNVSMAVGTTLGGVALHLDSAPLFRALIAVNAVTLLIAPVLITRVPRDREAAAAERTEKAAKEDHWKAVRDLPFFCLTLVMGVFAMQFTLIEAGLPLWMAAYTNAPTWVYAAMMVLNCALVALFQIPASRLSFDARQAARVTRWAGFTMALACALWALAAGAGVWTAVLFIALGMLAQIATEVLQQGAGWTLGYALADRRSQGVYQGVYGSGFSAAHMLCPALFTGTVLAFGARGWLVLIVLFLAAGLAAPAVVRWAERQGGEWRGEPD